MNQTIHASHIHLRTMHLMCVDKSEYFLSTKQSCLTQLVPALFSNLDRTVSVQTMTLNIYYFFETPNHNAAYLSYWSKHPMIQTVDIKFTTLAHPNLDPSFEYNVRKTPLLYLSPTLLPPQYTMNRVSIRPYWHIPDKPENHYTFYRTLIDFFMKIPVSVLYFSFINPTGFPIYLEQYADTFFTASTPP